MEMLSIFSFFETWGGLALLSMIPVVVLLMWFFWKEFKVPKKEVINETIKDKSNDTTKDELQVKKIFESKNLLAFTTNKKSSSGRKKTEDNKDTDNLNDTNQQIRSTNQRFIINSSILR